MPTTHPAAESDGLFSPSKLVNPATALQQRTPNKNDRQEFTVIDLAKRYDVCDKTIRRWRSAMKLPPDAVRGGIILWRLGDIEAWEKFGYPPRHRFVELTQPRPFAE